MTEVFNKRQEDVDLAIVKSDISFIKEKVKDIDHDLQTKYVSQDFFDSKIALLEAKIERLEDKVSLPIKMIYIFTGTCLLALLSAALSFLITRP